MSASTKDIKKLAQAYLRSQGFYSGDIDGVWGRFSKKAFDRYTDHLKVLGVDIGGEQTFAEDSASDLVSGVVVLDPGHGGSRRIGGSSPNNATSASGQLEKTMTLDLAKRLIDYGYHPPTVYFPLIVHGAIMIEPTESESLEGLDRFADAMLAIAEEARETPELVCSAPHHTRRSRLDETRAARQPVLRWQPAAHD